VIKQLRFATRAADVSEAQFAARWMAALVPLCEAPARARPLRVAACATLHNVLRTPSPHDGVELTWFADLESCNQFEAWRRTPEGCSATQRLSTLEDNRGERKVIANEEVVRGADWLQRRWSDGREKLKHMALAHRAAGITRAELSERWRKRAGQVGAAGAATLRIPDAARGLAYVQNHPLPGPVDWAYDAINEVYFDDIAAMRARIDFFETHDVAAADADLFSAPRFLAVVERVIGTAAV
jgi:hypothetical protein